MKPSKKGLARIIDAAGYSMRGLLFAWRNESAFRQELIGAVVLIPLTFFLAESALEVSILLIPIFLVVVVELLNSAVEAITDRVGSELHELSGAAKDLGSAAVLISLFLLFAVWGVFLIEKVLP